MTSDPLELLKYNRVLNPIDVHFARFLGELCGNGDSDIVLGAALASRATGAGDICLDLNAVSGTILLEPEAGQPAVSCPRLGQWEKQLRGSAVVGRPGDHRPLILDDHHRLYLYRYWRYEKDLSDFVLQRIRSDRAAGRVDPQKLRAGLARIFPPHKKDGVDWQKIAAMVAVSKSFSVITGGPGTGKTSVVAAILALLLELHSPRNPRIALAAPTGKAAARLGEALRNARSNLTVTESIRSLIPTEAVTIHRLLGAIPGTPSFRHNASNPLVADAVIVDEASMVDLALMAKLVAALEDRTQLVLIGDKDQLASVEAGAVLGDLCDRSSRHGYSKHHCRSIRDVTGEDIRSTDAPGAEQSGLPDCIVSLRKSFRFAPGTGIDALSRHVNSGDARQAMNLLQDDSEPSVRWVPIDSVSDLHKQLTDAIGTRVGEYLHVSDPQQALDAFQRLGLLCAVNRGPWGVAAINDLVQRLLSTSGLIDPGHSRNDPWFAGRPVMITRNDYHLGLYNGDIGIALPGRPLSHKFDPRDPDNGRLLVYFRDVAGQRLRQFPVYRLSDHQTVYAMTVHKSQGSEFDIVHLILPDRESMLLSRELLYTGITRARKEVVIWGPERVICDAIGRETMRSSGLRDALWP